MNINTTDSQASIELISAQRWNIELLDRRVRFMARRFDNRVALLLLSLGCEGKPLTKQQSNQLKDGVFAKIEQLLEGRTSSIMMLDETTVAIVIPNMELDHNLKTLVNKIIRDCSVIEDNLGQSVYLDTRGGLSTPLLQSVEVSSLIPFSQMALTRAPKFAVVYYPKAESAQSVLLAKAIA